jgi:hypothetical protein
MAEPEELSTPFLETPVFADMAIQGGKELPWSIIPPAKVNEPVHEQMTIAALIHSDYKLDPSLTFHWLRDNPTYSSELNDFVRGVMWNDDPECLLFDEKSGINLEYSYGAIWAKKFKSASLFGFLGFNKAELIARSHFGDLQWLHAMGSQDKELAIGTKENVLRWMETMYKVATGSMDPNTQIQDTWMRDWFHDPSNYTSVGELLTHRHPSPANISHRAYSSRVLEPGG